MITQIEETHKGLEIVDVLLGNSNVYQRFYMEMDQNKILKKKTLAQALRTLVEAENEPYVELTITMKRKDDTDPKAEVLPFVPQLRVTF